MSKAPVRLRYTGEQATTFKTGNVGHVEPQSEFTVPGDLADRFLARPDVQRATGRRSRQAAAAAPETAGDDGAQDSTGGDGLDDPSGEGGDDGSDPDGED